MSTSHTTLSSAADERKSRLAKLAGLKRKQPGSSTTIPQQSERPQSEQPTTSTEDSTASSESTSLRPSDAHLSSRNYDPLTRAPRLGFDASTTLLSNPTVESQSTTLLTSTLTTAQQSESELAAREATGQGGIDLFKIQPKKPNWDLKRELQERQRRWGVEAKTQNAIARAVRERIQSRKTEVLEQKKRERQQGVVKEDRVDEEGDGEEVGIEGAELVEGMHLREREEEEEKEEERREREREREENEEDGM